MTNNNIARSQKYLAIAQAIHAELDIYFARGDVDSFEKCDAILEFTDADARNKFAFEIEKIVQLKVNDLDLSKNAQMFLIEHFQMKITSANLTKCMLEQLCFSPVGILPTALTYLVYSHLAHKFENSQITEIDYSDHYKFYAHAVNELMDQQLPEELINSLVVYQSVHKSIINQSLFEQFTQMHTVGHNSQAFNHTFLWIKPERIITDPIESDGQLRVEFSKIYGELVSYVLGTKQFQDCAGKLMNMFSNGACYGTLHNTLASFIQYPILIFMSASDNAAMAQRLGEGFFSFIFNVFAPSLTLEDTPTNYNAHVVPVMSLDEVSKKVALTYLAGILDWYRSLCFGSEYFNRLTAFACFDYHENLIKTIYPKGFKTVVDVKPLEFKVMVWNAYERGLDLSQKRTKKSESLNFASKAQNYTEPKEPLKI